MANTCPGFSETGSLSNIRFPLSQENSWNSQALGTDVLDHTMVTRRGHCSLRTPFPTWQGLGVGQPGDPCDSRGGRHFCDWGAAWGGDVGHRVSQLRKAAPPPATPSLGSWDRLEASHVKQTCSLHRCSSGKGVGGSLEDGQGRAAP